MNAPTSSNWMRWVAAGCALFALAGAGVWRTAQRGDAAAPSEAPVRAAIVVPAAPRAAMAAADAKEMPDGDAPASAPSVAAREPAADVYGAIHAAAHQIAARIEGDERARRLEEERQAIREQVARETLEESVQRLFDTPLSELFTVELSPISSELAIAGPRLAEILRRDPRIAKLCTAAEDPTQSQAMDALLIAAVQRILAAAAAAPPGAGDAAFLLGTTATGLPLVIAAMPPAPVRVGQLLDILEATGVAEFNVASQYKYELLYAAELAMTRLAEAGDGASAALSGDAAAALDEYRAMYETERASAEQALEVPRLVEEAMRDDPAITEEFITRELDQLIWNATAAHRPARDRIVLDLAYRVAGREE